MRTRRHQQEKSMLDCTHMQAGHGLVDNSFGLLLTPLEQRRHEDLGDLVLALVRLDEVDQVGHGVANVFNRHTLRLIADVIALSMAKKKEQQRGTGTNRGARQEPAGIYAFARKDAAMSMILRTSYTLF